MEQSRRIVASALLGVLCVGLCLAQHWSYGLQPGGKRSAGDLLGPFQEVGAGLGDNPGLEKMQLKSDRGFPLHLSVCLSPRHPQIWGLTIVLSRIWKIRGEMPFVRLAQRTAARGFGQPAPGERCSSEVQVKPDSILSLNSNILMGYFMTIPPPPLEFWQFARGGCSAIK